MRQRFIVLITYSFSHPSSQFASSMQSLYAHVRMHLSAVLRKHLSVDNRLVRL